LVSRRFIALYAVAQVGAFIAFLPLLQVLLPLRATAIDPAGAAVLLSHIGIAGAVVASLANILFGMLSDRTRSPRGRRQPWVLGGLAATLASYALVYGATTQGGLLAGIIAFQFAFNAMFSALGAILADYVPERQQGLMSALLGLGYPLGSLLGMTGVGAFQMPDPARYAVVGLMVAGCVLPFALGLRERGRGALARRADILVPRATGRGAFARLVGADFVLVWVSRMLVVITLGVIQGYTLLFLRGPGSATIAFARPEAMIAQMTAIATVCNIGCGLLSGVLSDRTGRRKPFVVAGGLLLAAGMLCLAWVPGRSGLYLAAILYGAGNGLYATVDLTLMVQILPSIRRAGQYLGLMNLANTMAQIIAPLLALHVLGGATPDYHALFTLAAVASLLGAGCILGVTGRR
jgi:MFS family permease